MNSPSPSRAGSRPDNARWRKGLRAAAAGTLLGTVAVGPVLLALWLAQAGSPAGLAAWDMHGAAILLVGIIVSFAIGAWFSVQPGNVASPHVAQPPQSETEARSEKSP